MSMYGKTHYNIVISFQLIKINGKKVKYKKIKKRKSYLQIELKFEVYDNILKFMNYKYLVFQDIIFKS